MCYSAQHVLSVA